MSGTVRRWPAALALALAMVSLGGCGAPPVVSYEFLGVRALDERLQQDQAGFLLDAAAMHRAFEIVRAELYGEPAPAGEAPFRGAAQRRVLVCAYGAAFPTPCVRDLGGGDLADGLRLAAVELRDLSGVEDWPAIREQVRLKIDIVARVTEDRFFDDYELCPPERAGLYGYWVESAEDASWIAPSEVLEWGLYHGGANASVDRRRLAAALVDRDEDLVPPVRRAFPYQRLRTVAWIERESRPGAPREIFRIVRLHDHAFAEPRAEELLQRAVWAGDYVMGALSADGRFAQGYDVVADAPRSMDAVGPHVDGVRALSRVFARTAYRPYGLAARAAVDRLLERSGKGPVRGPHGGGEALWVEERGVPSVTASAEALLGLVSFVEILADGADYAESTGAYGRFLVARQSAGGGFEEKTAKGPGRATATAVLALARLHGLDRDSAWLDAALRGAEALVRSNAGEREGVELIEPVAIAAVLRFVDDAVYREHAARLAAALLADYDTEPSIAADYPDYLGAYGDPPRSAPAASFALALVASLESCRRAGDDCGELAEALESLLRNQLSMQFTPDLVWWPPNPGRALGGWARGLADPEIGLDSTARSLLALLAMEELLVGGPPPAPPAARVAELRAATRRYRGATLWER